MPFPCDHHDHTGRPAEPAVWRATTGDDEVVLGDFCTEHLGDGLDDFDATVVLTRVEDHG